MLLIRNPSGFKNLTGFFTSIQIKHLACNQINYPKKILDFNIDVVEYLLLVRKSFSMIPAVDHRRNFINIPVDLHDFVKYCRRLINYK